MTFRNRLRVGTVASCLCALLVGTTARAGVAFGSSDTSRIGAAIAWGLGGASVAYYHQKMQTRWFHRIIPGRFSPAEAAFVMGGTFAFLAYTGALASAARSSASLESERPWAATEPEVLPLLSLLPGGATVGFAARF